MCPEEKEQHSDFGELHLDGGWEGGGAGGWGRAKEVEMMNLEMAFRKFVFEGTRDNWSER